MEDVGLKWNPRKCDLAHFKRGVRVPESIGLLMSDGNVKIPTLEDGQQSLRAAEPAESAAKIVSIFFSKWWPIRNVVYEPNI